MKQSTADMRQGALEAATRADKTLSWNKCKAALKGNNNTSAMLNLLKLHPLTANTSNSKVSEEKR